MKSSLAVLFGLSLALTALPLKGVEGQDVDVEDDLDEEDDAHPLTNMPLESESVSVTYKFSDLLDDGLVMGERVGVVVGIINKDEFKEINVTSAMGSLNHPTEFGVYVANFSQQIYNSVTIPPGQECSFTYNFYSPGALQVDYPYQMALTVFYEDDHELFSDTFYNGTVSFVEPDLEWDSNSIFETFLLFALAGSMFVYSRKVWSPQASAFGSGVIDTEHIEKINKKWAGDAIKKRRSTPKGSVR